MSYKSTIGSKFWRDGFAAPQYHDSNDVRMWLTPEGYYTTPNDIPVIPWPVKSYLHVATLEDVYAKGERYLEYEKNAGH